MPCRAPTLQGLGGRGRPSPQEGVRGLLVRCPRPGSELPGSLQVLLQVLIILTGNYNFFNLLTIVLAFSLLDDEHVGLWLGRSRKRHGTGESLVGRRRFSSGFSAPNSWVWVQGWVLFPVQLGELWEECVAG